MMRHNLIILLCALGLMAAGCSIHEVPEGGDDAALALSLEIYLNQEVPVLSRINYSTKSAASEARYIVRFFPIVGDHYIKDAPFEFVANESDLTDRRYVLDVPPMNYHLEVWADWVDASEPYYNAADFGAIEVNTNPYSGACLHRDAFCGAKDLDLSGYNASNSVATATITLSRPNARLSFIATDKDDFIDYWAGVIAMNNGTGVKDLDAVDLSAFKVVVTYPQYMPSVYNLHDGVVTDSATGVSFETTMHELKDGSLEVAWDWILATDSDASVVVSLAIYDDEGNLINQISNLQVPLSPGFGTTVSGKLLTSSAHSGVVLDPTFDGEYIVHI